MRFSPTSLAAGLVLFAAVYACGSSTEDETHTTGAAPDGPGADAGVDSSARPVPRDFPGVVPSVGGYGLEDVWSGSEVIYVPAALVWRKTKGAPFALEREGEIVLLEGNQRNVVLDFSDAVHLAGEGGALGLALHPQFGDGTGPKPYAYVWYNANAGTQRLSRFTWNAGAKTFDRASELVMVEEAEEHDQHNGAKIAFGPDGFLYFGNGNDLVDANHQTLTRALFAGVFRIDVDQLGGATSHPPPRQPLNGTTKGYFIPNDNPFVGVANANEEFWALGFRNPFSFSFDRGTGQLWLGDVGETFREEIDLVVKGGNYEWPYKEGDLVVGTTPPTIGTPQGPKYAYTHSEMADLAAVFGGYVYRGKALPELVGKYVYTDYISARVWALDPATGARTTLVDDVYGREPLAVAEDEDGELYMLQIGGAAKLVRDPSADAIPKTISETKIYADVPSQELADGFVPYELQSPLWSDGAAKKRFVKVPAGKKVTFDANGDFVFPVGTIFVKEFDLPDAVVPKDRTRHLETRVLVVTDKTTYGLTYRWNAAGTDGELVREPTDEPIEDTAASATRSWHYPNFGQCWSCHREKNRVLGFTSRQLSRTRADGGKQLDALVGLGVFDGSTVATFAEELTKPTDGSATLEARAMAYLAANCSSCHRTGNSFLGGGQTWNALPGLPLDQRGLVGAPHHNDPMAERLGLAGAPLVDPGHPEHSVLLARMKSTDEKLRMPPLGRNMVDPIGVSVVEQWIASLPAP